MQEINRLKRNDLFFKKKYYLSIYKLKFENISIVLSMYEQNTCKDTWKKAGKRKQNFQKFCQIIK